MEYNGFVKIKNESLNKFRIVSGNKLLIKFLKYFKKFNKIKIKYNKFNI